MIRCPRCEIERPAEAFGKNAAREDGLALYCRECYRVIAKEYRDRVRRPNDRVRKTADMKSYMKGWLKAHPGYESAKRKEYREKDPEKFRARDREKYARKQRKKYGEDWSPRPKITPEEARSRRTARSHALRKKQPEKWKARHVVSSAVARGSLVPRPCFVCDGKAEGHHPDYAKSREVVWICHAHHLEIHRLLLNPIDFAL